MSQKIFTYMMNIFIVILCYVAYKDGHSEFAIYYAVVFSIYVMINLFLFIFKKLKR